VIDDDRKRLGWIAQDGDSSMIAILFTVSGHGVDLKRRAGVFSSMTTVQVYQEIAAAANEWRGSDECEQWAVPTLCRLLAHRQPTRVE
jgi:hypothetical protein